MFRSSKRTGMRSYATGSFSAYLATQQQASSIAAQLAEEQQCQVVNAQKNKLLTSLASYFASEMEKDQLKTDLRQIKATLAKDCPTYTQTNVNACC